MNNITNFGRSADIEVKDYSSECNLNDKDETNPCSKCSCNVFPIGCMEDIYHHKVKEID